MKTVTFLALAFLLALTSCELITGPDSESQVTATAGESAVTIRNAGDRPIYYFAIEQSTAARTLWGPCDDPDACNSVPGGATRMVPFEEVAGYSPEAEVLLVYWWHLVPKPGGGFEPDSLRFEEVRL